MPVTIGPNRATTGARIVLRVFRTFFLLFLMPFAGIGLLVTIIAVINLIFGGITRGWLFTATFGAAFGGFGFWMMYLVFTSGKEQEIVFTRYAEHPNAPWMWRQDWASGRIESGAKASVVAPWVVAILWILISSPTSFIFIRLAPMNRLALLALLFPAIGAGLLISAIRQTLRIRKFGLSYLQLATMPGVIGGKLSGVIEAHFDPTTENQVRVMLACIDCYRASETTDEKIIWKDEHVFGRAEIGIGPTGAIIPVDFEIPGNLPPTDGAMKSQILWRVDVKAEVPGLDYSARFDVPVFKTVPSATNQSQTSGKVSPPEKPSIIVAPMTTGGVEFVFPAARNIGMAVGVTLGFFIVTTIMIAARPSFFGILITGFFVIFLFVLTLQAWFEVERIVVEPDTITTRKTIFGFGPVRQFACTEVADLKIVVGMHSGRASSGSSYYDIQLINRDGYPFKLAGEIKDKCEADWILSQIRKAARLSP